VTPALVELAADAGVEGTQDITIINRGDEAFDITGVVAPLHAMAGDLSAVEWLTIDPPSFRLDPGNEQTIRVAVTIPSALASGGRYAAVIFTSGEGKISGSGATLRGQITVPFLIAVDGEGDLDRAASIEQFAPILERDGRIGFQALIRNDGNLHFVSQGSVRIGEAGDEPFGALDFPASTPLLPSEQSLITAQGSLPLEDGKRYAASTAISFEGDDPVQASAEFTVQLDRVMSLGSASVCENLDRGPSLAITLQNGGDLGIRPVVQLEVRDANGNSVGSTQLTDGAVFWPHQQTEIVTDLPQRLVTGQYSLIARVTYGTAEPIVQETPFSIGGDPATAAPLCANPSLG
jgi:hypothetical protein